jgi:hypothetical protein
VHELVDDDSGCPACHTTVIKTQFLHSTVQHAKVTPATISIHFR